MFFTFAALYALLGVTVLVLLRRLAASTPADSPSH
jgi:hypothetical protein